MRWPRRCSSARRSTRATPPPPPGSLAPPPPPRRRDPSRRDARPRGPVAGNRSGLVLLLTGASGTVGGALLRRLIVQGMPVRCLVRDPKELGADRVRVQIALGDLADPPSFRNAMRGIDTVIHLAGSGRDQAGGSIEELNGIATWRMVGAAERAGVKRFVFLSAMGAATYSRTRLHRAKALAERVVVGSSLRTTVL